MGHVPTLPSVTGGRGLAAAGGGGGYFAGGGGGGAFGGGGGSGFTPTGVVLASGKRAGDGQVVITWQGFQYQFAGFLAPVDNDGALNVVEAGQAVRVKFSLGGNQGLAVLAPGSPSSQPIAWTPAEAPPRSREPSPPARAG